MLDRPRRLLRHLSAPAAQGVFPEASLQRIAAAVAEGERRHHGELCFAVEHALAPMAVLRGLSARQRAGEVFAQLRVWDTRGNNGVLLYLLLADHRIEVVADRGLDGLVSDAQWRGVCLLMEERMRAGDPEAAAVAGARAVSDLLAAQYPRVEGDADENELTDTPHLL